MYRMVGIAQKEVHQAVVSSSTWPRSGWAIKIRRPASALLDKLLCPPGPGSPAAAG